MSYELPSGWVISFFCRHYKDTILAVGLSSNWGYFLRLFPLAKAGIQNIKTSEGICEGECHFGGFGVEAGEVRSRAVR
jgi:hypothetical protein